MSKKIVFSVDQKLPEKKMDIRKVFRGTNVCTMDYLKSRK
jgi:hypothetical protein